MPRTFVWHPTRGPKKAPTFKFPKAGKVKIRQIRSGIGHTARMRATLRAIGLKQLTTVEQIARERGVEPSSLQYRSRAKSKEAV